MSDRMTTKGSISVSQAVWLGMISGMQAWTCYWTAETSFVTLVRWLLRRHESPPQPPLFVGMLLLMYLCAGGFLGAAAGWVVTMLRPAAPRRAILAGSTLTMLLVFSIFTRHFIEAWKGPVLAVLALCCLASAGSGIWAKRLSAFANPWIASLLAVGAYVSYASGSSEAKSLGMFLGFAVVVMAAGVLWARFTENLSIGRSFAVTMAAALVFCGFSMALMPTAIRAAGAHGTAPAGSPNVILIVMDTTGAEHMSVYGYGRDTTPQLRAFARQATTYTHSYSAGDMTLIGHASMFTGLYPTHHGAHYAPDSPLGRPLDEKYQTLAERLSDKGYRTMGVVANDGYVSEAYGLAQGFAYYDQRPPRTPQRATPLYTLSGRILENLSDRWPTRFFMRSSRTAEEINVEVDQLLSGGDTAQHPFLLFLNYLDAHTPYTPPPPYDRMYPGKDDTLNRPRLDQMRWDLFTKHQPMSQAAVMHLVSQYDGEIAYLDHHLGQLFASLKSKGLFDNSLIVVTADHGEAFGEHDILNHGGMALYQSQTFIPLLIKYPHQTTGAVVDAAVSGVDLLPTVFDSLKLPVPAGLDGGSLLQIDGTGRAVISESYPGGTAVYINPKRFGRTYNSIQSWPFKLIRPSAGPVEMYDLSADPGEHHNLYDPQNSTANLLSTRLGASLHAPAEKGKPPSSMDPATVQRLKSLGYIQ